MFELETGSTPQSRSVPHRSMEHYLPSSINLLVVEDDAADFMLIDRLLKRIPEFHIQVTHTQSIKAAETALSAKTFDLALLDYSVHENCGTELLPKLDRCPAILLTSLLASDIESEARNLGVVACLEKDEITLRVLSNTMRLALRGAALEERLNSLSHAQRGHHDF